MSAMMTPRDKPAENQCRARTTTNAFDRLMKSAQAPGAFDLAVDYYYNDEDETISDDPPATCTVHHWRKGHSFYAYDPVFREAMEKVERAAFQDFQEEYIGGTLYPLYHLREKMTSSRKKLAEQVKSTQTTTSPTALPTVITIAAANLTTTGSDTAKAATLEEPAKDARVTKLTAHFGSPPLERGDTDDEEPSGDIYDSDCCEIEDSDDYFTLGDDYDSYNIESRKDQPYIPIIGFVLSYSDGIQVEVGNLRGSQCTATIKLHEDEDILRMVQRTKQHGWGSRSPRKAYAGSVGVWTSHDRWFYFERGLLYADFGGSRSYSCDTRGQDNHSIPVKELPVEHQPTARGGMAGYRKHSRRFRGLEWSIELCRIKSIVNQEHKDTPKTCVYEYQDDDEPTTMPFKIGTLASLAHKAIPTPKEAFEKYASQEKQAASELLEEYTALLKCIQCAAQTALLNWLLSSRSHALQHIDAREKEVVLTQRLEMELTFPVSLNNTPPASFIEEGTKRCAACGTTKSFAGYSRTQWVRGRLQRRCCDCVHARHRFVDFSDIPEGRIMLERERAKMKQEQTKFRAWTQKQRRIRDLQGRHREDREHFHAERKEILAINSKVEQAALSEMVHKVVRGVKYHVQRLPPSFESRLLSVEDGLANEYSNICSKVEENQSMFAIHLHGGTKEVCKRAGCFAIFDPALVRNRKKCSIPQCFATPSSANCGCSVEDCKYCLEPFCPGHMKPHADACSSSFPFRCGFKNGTTRLRHEQCGALLSESTCSRKRCASCGVQCCDQCVVKCVGHEETDTKHLTYCIPLMGLPKPKPPPPPVTCEAVWCLFCRGGAGGRMLDDNRCKECEEKIDQLCLNWEDCQYEYTGYSERSEDDSDYTTGNSVSSEEDPLEDTDDEEQGEDRTMF